MNVANNRELSVVPPTAAASPLSGSLSARDYARDILHGSSGALDHYLKNRTFETASHPAWFRDECWKLGEKRFNGVGIVEAMTGILNSALTRHFAKPVQTWICKNIYLRSPFAVSQMVQKELSHSVQSNRPRFDDARFDEIGIPSHGVLEQLLEPQIQDESPQSKDPREAGAARMAAFLESTSSGDKLKKMEGMLEQLICFNPFDAGPFGTAAVEAYREIGQAILRYSVMKDVLDSFDIELTEKRARDLYYVLSDTPPSNWQDTPQMKSLLAYAKAIALDPTLVEHQSRKEIFSKFAAPCRPIHELHLEVDKLRARHQTSSQSTNSTSNGTSEETSVAPIDDIVASLEKLYRDWEVDPGKEDLAPLRLARIAVSKGASFGQLERILISNEFSGAAVLNALRADGRDNKGARSSETGAGGAVRRISTVEIDTIKFDLLLHQEGNRAPFVEWYSDLEKAQQGRVDVALKQLEDGHLGTIRKLSTRATSEADVSAYELKIAKDGLRIYFRYLPNYRVILLGAGNKDSQERDVPLMMQRAGGYNGRNDSLAEGLRNWGSGSKDERTE